MNGVHFVCFTKTSRCANAQSHAIYFCSAYGAVIRKRHILSIMHYYFRPVAYKGQKGLKYKTIKKKKNIYYKCLLLCSMPQKQ